MTKFPGDSIGQRQPPITTEWSGPGIPIRPRKNDDNLKVAERLGLGPGSTVRLAGGAVWQIHTINQTTGEVMARQRMGKAWARRPTPISLATAEIA